MSDSLHAEDIDVILLMADLWRAKYVIIAIVALASAASVYTALTATPKFAASAVVTQVTDAGMTKSSSFAAQLGGLGGLAGFDFGSSGGTHESQALLESRQMAQTFIQRYDLIDTLIPAAAEAPSLWRAVKIFREQVLKIRADSKEGLTTISVIWTDPKTAATWANDYVALANESIRDRAIAKSTRNIEFLNGQIAQTNVTDLLRVMYNLVQNETKTLMLANARPDYAFAVVDPAVAPEVRTSPRRKIIVLSGAFFGLIAALVLVLCWRLIKRVKAAF